MNLSSKRIMLTGGAGFLGSFVTEKPKVRGCKSAVPSRRKKTLISKKVRNVPYPE